MPLLLLLIPAGGLFGWFAWKKVQEIALPVAIVSAAAVGIYLVWRTKK